MKCLLFLTAALVSLAIVPSARAADFPPVSELKPQAELPDPLVMFDGRKVTTPEQWTKDRRPELKALFQHYMYGYLPPKPEKLAFRIEREDKQYFGGKATKREVTISYGPEATPPLHVLLVVPNRRTGPVPAFFGLNFCGNHTAVDDPTVPLPTVWMRESCPGCETNKATDAGRGKQKDIWDLENTIEKGYAVATAYCGDIDPDKPDFTDGVHPHFLKPGQKELGPNDWGTIAAWAWGLHRIADYLVTDKDIDAKRLAVVGHSRLGKTALLAGAFDDRIAVVIPHQAGTGGSSPSRKTGESVQKAESVKRINDSFPHWFNDEFTKFNEQVDRLPFDQNCLVALCAPRAVLLTNAQEDQWADPDGQFHVLHAAEPVYKLLNAGAFGVSDFPEDNKLVGGKLAYYIRPGKHSMMPDDWKVFIEFADRQFGIKR